MSGGPNGPIIYLHGLQLCSPALLSSPCVERISTGLWCRSAAELLMAEE